MDGSWPLTGRDAELRAIVAALDGTAGRGVVLAGQAGVGKTRLAREAVSRLAASGRPTDWVAATRAAASIPFGAASHLLPAPERDGPEGVAGRLQMLQATAERFAARAAGPVVLGVDDAHLLDDATAALVHQLVTRGLAMVVVTVRSGEPVPEPVLTLWKEGLAKRLAVHALPPAAVDELLGHVLGPDVDGVTRQELRRTTGGNPLLLRELVLSATEAGTLRQRDGVWHWSGGVRDATRLTELVGTRLEGLPAAARAVLEVVACGEPLPLAMVERLAGHEAAAAAERSGLAVVERSGNRYAIRLDHPLYGEVIRATLPVSRARAVWGELAGALAAGPMRRSDDVLLAGAWQLWSGTVTHPELLLPAARQAMRRFDHALAERLAAAAHEAGAGWDAVWVLAEALGYQGRSGEAAATLTGQPPSGSGEQARARWAVTRAIVLYWGLDLAADEAQRVLDEAPEQAEAEATRAWILLFDGRCRQALEVAEQVLRSPRATTEAVVRAAVGGVAAAGMVGCLDEALALRDRGLEAVGAGGDELPWARAQLGWATCSALLLAGRVREAWELAVEGYRTALVTRSHGLIGGWAGWRGLVAKARGRVATAQASLRESAALLDTEHDPFQFVRVALVELAGAAALAGDTVAASAWMERAEHRHGGANSLFDTWVERDRTWVAVAAGLLSQALAHARKAAALAYDRDQPAIEALALYDVARLGAPAEVADRLDELAAVLEGPLAAGLAAAATALAASDGPRLDDAATAFADLGMLLLAAEAAAAASRAHRATGLRARASGSLERSLALAGECEGARTPLLDPADLGPLLTRREREVVLLAAGNHTSRAIAERLSLSVRTVDNYLGRAYAKLGVSGRNDLPALVGRNGS